MAELQDELLKKCIVCGGENSRKNPCTKKPKIEDVSDTLDRCQLLKKSGDHEVTPLLQRLLRAQGENLLGSVRYHSECRKPIMHEKRKRSYSESAISKTPAKPGRPAVLSPEARPKRSASAMPPKEARCMFSSCTFCTTDPYTDVHKVLTDAMGEKLIYIKNNTKVDSVRVCVSDLEGIGKASLWDKITKLKLKIFSNWMEKTRVTLGDKVIKLREERQLFARFLVIQQSRPELVPKLEATIGEYEMAVVPRSMFAVDGSLLVCKEKSNLVTMIENVPVNKECDDSDLENVEENPSVTTEHLENILPDIPSVRVLIVDAMAILQGMKKTPGMTSIADLKKAYVNKILRISKGYDETRIIFDHYLENSLKAKTRASRATSGAAEKASYSVHDNMSIKTISLKELLSSSSTKNSLTVLLSEALLSETDGSTRKVVVSFLNCTKVNSPHSLSVDLMEHGHEEADTLIPLHVLDTIRETTFKEIHVRCSDTDVFVLLMDLASDNRLGPLTKLIMLTGVGAKYREIDVRQRVEAVGILKAQGLIGLHNFSGADWGGKFVGVSKKTWVQTFLSLPDDDDIVECFKKLGCAELSNIKMDSSGLPCEFKELERFVCIVCSSSNGPLLLSSLRWEMFRARNLQGELLPPTRATLFSHIQRANYICKRDKSYVYPKPALPKIEENGWNLRDNSYEPVRCVIPPAPKAVLELTKCGCRKKCSTNCSCLKNKLPCTALCKCYAWGCNSCSEFQKPQGDHCELEEEDDE